MSGDDDDSPVHITNWSDLVGWAQQQQTEGGETEEMAEMNDMEYYQAEMTQGLPHDEIFSSQGHHWIYPQSHRTNQAGLFAQSLMTQHGLKWHE
jgi:hypothetical protein